MHPLVETAWLEQHLNDPELRILDCTVVREDKEDGSFAFVGGIREWEASHIAGSIFVDVLAELSDPDHPVPMMMPAVEKFAAILGAKGVGDNHTVVLYDRSNHAWAARVWWMLKVCGFENAAVLNGGWGKWTAEGLPVTADVTSYPPATLSAKPRPQLMADKAEMLANLDRQDTCAIYALPPAMFSGEVTPYARPGRIPGSKNVFVEDLLDKEKGTYLDLESLRELYKNSGALDAERVVTYCGGGIAASSNALSLTLLGHDNVAVYDGSLMEWTADPDLPMETD